MRLTIIIYLKTKTKLYSTVLGRGTPFWRTIYIYGIYISCSLVYHTCTKFVVSCHPNFEFAITFFSFRSIYGGGYVELLDPPIKKRVQKGQNLSISHKYLVNIGPIEQKLWELQILITRNDKFCLYIK
jgi:hypothetical protein